MDVGEDKVTFTISSCGRLHLLERTLKSFIEHNTWPIEEVVIVDDSAEPHDWKPIEELLEQITPHFLIIENPVNIGQYKSLDIMYPIPKTKWIFHCEDDWIFLAPGFIESSMEVFHNYDGKLFTVNIWGKQVDDHPDRCEPELYDLPSGRQYKIINWKHKLGGFNQNPGLRLTKVVQECLPYAEVPLFRKAGPNREPYVREASIALKYIRELNYRSAYVVGTYFIDHIGWHDHVYPRDYGHE